MPSPLTAASVMMCPHGGTVIATPGSTRASAGTPVLRASDTFTIVGCPLPPTGTPHPCVSVKWDVTAQHVKHDNDFVLDEPISNGSHYSLATHAKPYSVGSGYRTWFSDLIAFARR